MQLCDKQDSICIHIYTALQNQIFHIKFVFYLSSYISQLLPSLLQLLDFYDKQGYGKVIFK